MIVGFISSVLSSQDFSPTLPIVQFFKTIASHILSIVIVVQRERVGLVSITVITGMKVQ